MSLYNCPKCGSVVYAISELDLPDKCPTCKNKTIEVYSWGGCNILWSKIKIEVG